jgi:hypothetical protein
LGKSTGAGWKNNNEVFLMNAFVNKKNSMIAILMAFTLVSAAFLGLAMIPGVMAAPGDIDDPLPNDDILEGAGIDMDWAYSTSTVTLQINHTLMGKSVNFFPVLFTIIVTDGMTDWELYRWTDSDGDLVNPYNWTMNMTASGDYTIKLTAVYYETVDGDYWGDSIDLDFTVLEGTGAINSMTGVPSEIPNDDSVDVNITLSINRLFTELDVDMMDVRIWHEDSMTWTDLEMDEPEPGNLVMDPVAHTTTGWTLLDVPFDTPVGEYKLMFQLIDLWGYEEISNETLFNVVWREMAPEMSDGMVSFDEDMYALVDPADHFMDKNEQPLTYWFNETLLENLTVVWEDDMLNFTAPMDWNGVETFTIMVSDSIANMSFDMTITVNEMEDDLMVSMDNTIMVDEMEMMASFDALMFFYDPDGPVENLTVSLGYDEITNETTNVTTMVPIYMYEDENITVTINETDFTNSMAKVNVDVEEGKWEFPITAWIDGNVTLDDEIAYVEIVPVNDVPMLSMDMVTVFKNEEQTINLSEYFTDPDGPMLNLTVDTNVTGAELAYDWETFMLEIVPTNNWTGTIDVEINATDGMDYDLYTLTIEVILRSYAVTGMVTFEDVDGVMVNMSNVTLTIGGDAVALDDNNSFSVILDEGDYEVVLTVPAEYLYDEAAEQSGYEMPTLEDIELTAPATYDISLEYMEYIEPTPTATWADINWTTKTIEDDDGNIIITVGVDHPDYLGYEDIDVEFVIQDDDEEYNFTMEWDPTEKMYVLELTEDELKDIPEGDQKYFFTDGTNDSGEYEYEFKEKDENANLITVIVLIVLIILVLIALVFIMRKPSEEEFDEEDEEEEEEGERSCPSCGETVTDEEAEECPYCGENMEE